MLKAFSVHIGNPLNPSRVRCVEHNREIVDLTMVGREYDAEVRGHGIRIGTPQEYSEVLRLILLSCEPNLLYLDTDCWLVEPPTFSGIGRSAKSNWAMYSGDNPGIFSRLLDHHKARREVNESADQHILSRSGAEVINAIHKWEIPWYKNQD